MVNTAGNLNRHGCLTTWDLYVFLCQKRKIDTLPVDCKNKLAANLLVSYGKNSICWAVYKAGNVVKRYDICSGVMMYKTEAISRSLIF